MGIEGKNNDTNRWTADPDSIPKLVPSSFGAPANTSQLKFRGIGSQRFPCFTKVYKLVRLKTSIIEIRKYYDVCL